MATSSIPWVAISQEEVNYTMMQMIMQNVCRKVLRTYLMKKVNSITPGAGIDTFLATNKTFITREHEGKLYERYFFPLNSNNHPVPSNLQDWDIQTISFILTKFCSLSPTEFADIVYIRETKSFLSHLGKPEVADFIFTAFNSDFDGLLKRLFRYLQDPKLENEINTYFKNVTTRFAERFVDVFKYLHFTESEWQTLRLEHAKHRRITQTRIKIMKTILNETREICSRLQDDARNRIETARMYKQPEEWRQVSCRPPDRFFNVCQPGDTDYNWEISLIDKYKQFQNNLDDNQSQKGNVCQQLKAIPKNPQIEDEVAVELLNGSVSDDSIYNETQSKKDIILCRSKRSSSVDAVMETDIDSLGDYVTALSSEDRQEDSHGKNTTAEQYVDNEVFPERIRQTSAAAITLPQETKEEKFNVEANRREKMPSDRFSKSTFTSSLWMSSAAKRDTDKSVLTWYETTLDQFPAYRIAARHLKDILLRSEYILHDKETFFHDQNELSKQRNKSISLLKSTHVHIHCNKTIAESLKSKTKLIQKQIYNHKSHHLCVEFQMPETSFGQSSSGTANQNIPLIFTNGSIRLTKTVGEEDVWTACNDILERFAFTAAHDTLRLYIALPMPKDAGQQETNQQLVQEIEALYERSMIPIEEKLRFKPLRTSKISEKVQRDLRDIIGVMAIQKTCSRVLIWVDPSKDQNDLSRRVKTCLKKNFSKVSYTVVPFEVEQYSRYVCGEKLMAKDGKSYGTLSGIFLSGDGKEKHLVLSKHVAERLGTTKVELRNNIIANIPEIVHDHPDIAVANVLEPFLTQCLTEFKSEDGHETSSRLCVIENKHLRGLHVFIWGATSKPGVGKIEDAEFDLLNVNHFIISDSSGVPFCQKGDSGAIVCSDERDGSVSLIAVVIGQFLNRSQYIALSLKEGMEILREKYGVSFAMMR